MCQIQSEVTGAYVFCRRILIVMDDVYAIPPKPITVRQKLRLAVVWPGVVRVAATSRTAQKCRTVGVANASNPAVSSTPLLSAVSVTTTNIRPVRAAAAEPMIM
jgi:hypothetical protein